MATRKNDAAEIRRLLETRETEQLTYGQLSARTGIPVHVFTYRAAQDRCLEAGSVAAGSGSFVELVPSTEPTSDREARGGSSGVELIHPDGLRIRLERQFDEAALARVLAIMRC